MIEFLIWLLGYFFIGFLFISFIYFYIIYNKDVDIYGLQYHWKEDFVVFILFYPIVVIFYLFIMWFNFLEKTAIEMRNKRNDK
jgi:hypothetical protein